MLTSRRKAALFAAAACLAAVPFQATVSAAADHAAPGPAAAQDKATYTVAGTDTAKRTQINKTGALVLSEKNGTATVEANSQQADALKSAGFKLENKKSVAEALSKRNPQAGAPKDFPPDDQGYHNFDEVNAELDKTVQEHPDIAQKSSMGKTFQGRDIPMLKLSDNVGQDENEPEVLFTCNQHAREHLTTEMCMHIIQRYTQNYQDPAIKNLVDNHEVWIVPVLNPDGSTFDVESGQYQSWRKNRQDSGTDTNRNFDYKWNCCGGSSNDPSAEDYHGPNAASAPEVQSLQKWVDSRVIGGVQQIKGHIDFHTYSELVMWPFGHTQDQVTEGMSKEEYDRFVKVGNDMAKTNGYKPEQSSSLYVTDGDVTDWMWGKHKIFSFTFEMFPGEGGGDGFYPPDEVIPKETARNDQAVDIMMNEAK